MQRNYQLATVASACALLMAGSLPLRAQDGWHDSLPIEPKRKITFETTEGSLMNLDLSPDGKTIVFDLLGDLYTIPVSGGKATRLTRGMAVDLHPVWSPSGKEIAFISDRSGAENLWIIRADGSGARRITKDREYPGFNISHSRFSEVEWMPDGQFLLSRDSLYHVVDGQRLFTVRGEEGVRTWSDARFSRDGRYLYFNRYGIRRHDLSTGETVQLAQPPRWPRQPVVSPNGRWLAYQTTSGNYNGLRIRDLETGEDRWLAYPLTAGGISSQRCLFTHDSRALLIAFGGKIHRIDVATGEDVVIPFKARVEAELGPFVHHRHRVVNDSLSVRYIRSPAISPDGKTLVFSALQRLYLMALPKGQPVPLVEQPGLGQFQPAFSPDGRWIAYVTWSDSGGGHVWRIPAAGGPPERLTKISAYYQRPAWSPDGTTLAILQGDIDAASRGWMDGWLQTMPSRGGTPRTIATKLQRESYPAFSADGKRIHFQDAEDGLVSVRLDGTDRRVIAYPTPHEIVAGEIVPSPDGRYVAYQFGRDHFAVYLAPLPADADSLPLGDATGRVPVRQLAATGARDLRWVPGRNILTWVSANRVHRVDADRVMALDGVAAGGPRAAAKRPAGDEHQVITVDLKAPRSAGRGIVALRGARVISMKGMEVIENATVVITHDRITAVGPASRVTIPRGATVIDVSGKTIIPGLVDLHAHFWFPRDLFFQRDWLLTQALAYGVTTSRDVSATHDQFGHVELIETGKILGPRLISVGFAVDANKTNIRNLDHALAVVRSRKELGGIAIKQYVQATRRQRQLLLQAADREGLNVTNEGGGPTYILGMALDGFTGFEHGTGGSELYYDYLRLFAEAKIWYTPTLMVGYAGRALPYFRARYRQLHDDPKYTRFRPHDWSLDRLRGGELDRPGDPDYMNFLAGARAAAAITQLGGNVTVGSHGEDQGIGAHWEMWTLQMGGLTNHEALMAATIRGAEGIGIDRDVGSIEVGKIADLMVLDANPLDDIENSLTIRYVMKNGMLHDGDTMDALWPEKRVTWIPARDDP